MWCSDNLRFELQEMSNNSLTIKEEAGKLIKKRRRNCDGQFCVSTWLGHSTQIFGQTLFWISNVSLKVFLDEMNI